MTATEAVTRDKAKPAPKDAIALLKADHKAVSEMFAEYEKTRLGANVAAAGETLHAKTAQLRETRDEWVEGAQSIVRKNPLACAAAAFGRDVLIVRMSRSYR
ncbi:hypothetical protein [Quisquiliibacterium transsilvanicum]|uniref:Uncharacterized protein n=1 Tax=Quisquiliibacterium transsilvanicum TaxID=1549638 RepID=A0A7W8M707_9BURK|nr:hypothetical protein [Quisquiliibacterium transsilvanicum]MBB5270446.1 hypothetical protein [Quisquiliibacterium transsilvanicum]